MYDDTVSLEEETWREGERIEDAAAKKR